MRLAANLTYEGAGDLARAAERLGYAMVLAPEGYRSDAASVLGLVAGQTSTITLASGVMQIPGRPPGMAALTAAMCIRDRARRLQPRCVAGLVRRALRRTAGPHP
ncbi:LLM class flavin-dependent oxidoreductase [Streptomyces sp. NRRL WC-3549]|uniref:LLM class flavin-dependent oxidoreductase n=1 Tax=Streptomyces sp. NRRL WC-3549 TaxID=1463925 RepID=UPI000B2E42DD|nr:LLM class flavin-dependent oxidoreductase [Streptomyces sp. NRRL WC-3549]